MPLRRVKRLLRSVRFRIAASTSIAVAAVAVTTLVGIRQSIRWTLTHELDQTLIEDASEVGLVIRELSPRGVEAIADELRRKATGHVQHRWFTRLLTAEGGVVWQSDLAEGAPPPEGDTDAPRPRAMLDYQTHESSAPPNTLSIATYQIGSSLRPVLDDLNRIDRIIAGATLTMLLVAPVCGYLLAGLPTREIGAMTARAASLRPTRMDERLPESGLDDEFDRLAKTVNGLLDRIAEFIREKQTFLANAAHELRTPIAAIRSSIEVTLASDRSTAEYQELLEQLIEDSESLEVLVNQVLLLSEAVASQNAPPKEAVALSDAVLRAIEMFRGVAESRQIDMVAEVEPAIAVMGIGRHLSQVVNNLLDNALKYTPESGRVVVTLAPTPGGEAVLAVADTGIGIAPEDVPRVFDRFFRADRARSRDATRGAGLGLSICKSIVEAHNGVLACDSVPGEGSRFTVRLPLPAPSA